MKYVESEGQHVLFNINSIIYKKGTQLNPYSIIESSSITMHKIAAVRVGLPTHPSVSSPIVDFDLLLFITNL